MLQEPAFTDQRSYSNIGRPGEWMKKSRARAPAPHRN